MNVLYSNVIKQKYIEEYVKRYNHDNVRYIFQKSKEIEEFYKKDISQFTLYEMEMFMGSQIFVSRGTARQCRTQIAGYIEWCYNNKIIDKKVVPDVMEIIKNKYGSYENWSNQFVSEEIRHLTVDQFNEIENRLINYQDKVVHRLLWEGATIDDLLSLKHSNIHGNTIIFNEGAAYERKIAISNHCAYLIQQANKERKYIIYRDNSKSNRGHKEKDYFSKDIPYLIKRTTGNVVENRDHQIVNRRLRAIKRALELEHYESDTIIQSRLIFEAKLIFESNKKYKYKSYLSNHDYSQIGRIFNYTKWESLRDYAYREMIEKMYGTQPVQKEEDNIYKFWRVQELYGDIGENIVEEFLNNCYGEKYVIRQVARKGYDFHVETDDLIKRVEVKTTTTKNSSIYISRNEVEKSDRYSSSYYIYIVHIQETTAEIYIIEKPVEFLQIDINCLNHQCCKKEGISMIPKSFEISLNENFYNSLGKPHIVPFDKSKLWCQTVLKHLS